MTAVVEGPDLNNNSLDVQAVQTYLKEQLADYKVPRKIYAISSMQRFANGKIDYSKITTFAADCLAKEGDH